jgi:TctA family transporter
VAGPEAANNAGAQASFIPLLCLGIPANAVIGVIMGALLMAGVTPGPMLIVDHPELFWGVIASMFVGNLMLVVLNVPLVGLFVSLLRVPTAIMSVLIVVFCVIGAFSLNNSMFDVGAMVGFGILGYAPCARPATMSRRSCWPSCSAACSSRTCGRVSLSASAAPWFF